MGYISIAKLPFTIAVVNVIKVKKSSLVFEFNSIKYKVRKHKELLAREDKVLLALVICVDFRYISKRGVKPCHYALFNISNEYVRAGLKYVPVKDIEWH